MITLEHFLNGIQKNENRIRKYVKGGDGRGGECDCIGLLIGAIRLAGGSWTGTHGSNYSARNEMRTLNPITSVNQLFLGEVVYKIRKPGDKYYDLPDKYKSSGDILDYYHVGVVTNLNPLSIDHCTDAEGGIKHDSTLGAWKYGGELKKVEYGGEIIMEPLYQAMVFADNQYPVKMRKQPRVNATIVMSVAQGTVVDVLETSDEWDYISVDGKNGYMMHKFLKELGESEFDNSHEELFEIRDQLANLLKRLDLVLNTMNLG